MEWHPILSSGSARSPLHPSLCSRHNASPWGSSQPEHSLKNTAQKGLDSDALDQPTIWHVQNTQSRSHFRAKRTTCNSTHQGEEELPTLTCRQTLNQISFSSSGHSLRKTLRTSNRAEESWCRFQQTAIIPTRAKLSSSFPISDAVPHELTRIA